MYRVIRGDSAPVAAPEVMNMSILVCKFGGSSTANAECLERVRAILAASPARRCAVLSAPGVDARHGEKVTTQLTECWRSRRDRRGRRALTDSVARRFGEIASGLGVAGFYDIAKSEIEAALKVSEAQAVSRGEYLCALLFSKYTGIDMEDAARLVAFDERGGLNAQRTLGRFIALSRGRDRVVVPGFYGAEPSGRIRVFPRNGSDITGALAAAGMGASLYENWTDVPGLMSADPSIVPEARLIGRVNYRQMRALARAGAQVLHPACLDPVASAGIPTRLCCTMRPEEPGTLIDDGFRGAVRCVVGKREAALPASALGEGVDVSCVSVFGVALKEVAEAAKLLEPLRVEPGVDCVRVYVERAAYEMSQRALHNRLVV